MKSPLNRNAGTDEPVARPYNNAD